jgi:predicted RNA-binding Zn-ribbon protein involved in translation (DUF1610 family)
MTKSLEYFIDKASAVHGTRYDYTNTTYHGMSKKLTVGCSIHGEFEQLASDHLAGRGCRFCNERQNLTLEQFVEKATTKHSSKYTYENVLYTNSATKVDITCPHHGSFLQKPNDHLTKYGCPSCGGTKKVTTTEFIKRATQAHGDAYVYHDVEMNGMNNNVKITCKIHGVFEQRPADHLNGVGCPICGSRKQGGGYSLEYFTNHPEMKSVAANLYLIEVDGTFCKIGITKKSSVKQRFPGMKFKVLATCTIPLYTAFSIEQGLLLRYSDDRYKVKSLIELNHTGWTECFPLSMVPLLKSEFDSINMMHTTEHA